MRTARGHTADGLARVALVAFLEGHAVVRWRGASYGRRLCLRLMRLAGAGGRASTSTSRQGNANARREVPTQQQQHSTAQASTGHPGPMPSHLRAYLYIHVSAAAVLKCSANMYISYEQMPFYLCCSGAGIDLTDSLSFNGGFSSSP